MWNGAQTEYTLTVVNYIVSWALRDICHLTTFNFEIQKFKIWNSHVNVFKKNGLVFWKNCPETLAATERGKTWTMPLFSFLYTDLINGGFLLLFTHSHCTSGWNWTDATASRWKNSSNHPPNTTTPILKKTLFARNPMLFDFGLEPIHLWPSHGHCG